MATNVRTMLAGKPLNRDLRSAQGSKKDEFYTQLSDIEKELKHYTPHFSGKTILCNCDDPRVSNFFHSWFPVELHVSTLDGSCLFLLPLREQVLLEVRGAKLIVIAVSPKLARLSLNVTQSSFGSTRRSLGHA